MDKYVTFVRKRKNDDQTDEPAPKILPKVNITPSLSEPKAHTDAACSDSDLDANTPTRPILKKFPSNAENRHFRSQWYETFSWLEYSIKKDRAFCFPCRVFGLEAETDGGFTTVGFNCWKNAFASKGFKQHDKSNYHIHCMAKWEHKTLVSEGKIKSISNILDPERESLVQTNRKYFNLLVKYHMYFCKNEMPYRGHDESEDSISPGKWKDFINCQLDTNPEFSSLYEKVKSQSDHDYTSKRSCNELVECLAEEVRDIILGQVNKAGVYSLLIDESKDNAGHEELALCLRYVANDKTCERFLCLMRVPKADAESLVQNHLLPYLQALKITSALIAGGADGASVMSGAYEGVFAKLKAIYQSLIYVHCAAHRLHLVVTCYLSSIPQSKQVISVYNSLHDIFNVANNREILEKHQREIYPKQRVLEFSSLTETRWSCKFQGIDKIIKRIKAILVSLQTIAGNNSNKSDKAAGVYHKMMSSQFITSLIFLHNILAITDGLNKHLQDTNVDWKAAQTELNVCKKLLADIAVTDLEESVLGVCSDISITTEYEDPIYATRRTLSDYFKMTTNQGKATVKSLLENLKNQTVKKLLTELDHRFSNMNSTIVASLDSLDAHSPNYLDYDKLKPLLENYEADVEINHTLLQSECKRAKLMAQEGSALFPDMYPNLMCVKISNTFPVNTAQVERGFSCMNRVISYTRTSLKSERASDLILLSLNKDLLSDVCIDSVISRWVGKRNGHIPLK